MPSEISNRLDAYLRKTPDADTHNRALCRLIASIKSAADHGESAAQAIEEFLQSEPK